MRGSMCRVAAVRNRIADGSISPQNASVKTGVAHKRRRPPTPGKSEKSSRPFGQRCAPCMHVVDVVDNTSGPQSKW